MPCCTVDAVCSISSSILYNGQDLICDMALCCSPYLYGYLMGPKHLHISTNSCVLFVISGPYAGKLHDYAVSWRLCASTLRSHAGHRHTAGHHLGLTEGN